MLNKEIEKRNYDNWLSGVNAKPMRTTDLARAVVHGVDLCQDYCLSRKYSGPDGCACIRSIFPHPSHHQLYQMLREKLLLAELSNAGKKEVKEC